MLAVQNLRLASKLLSSFYIASSRSERLRVLGNVNLGFGVNNIYLYDNCNDVIQDFVPSVRILL